MQLVKIHAQKYAKYELSSAKKRKHSSTRNWSPPLALHSCWRAWVGTVSTSLSSLESFYLLQSIRTTNGTTRQASPQERWNSRKSQGTDNTSAHPSYQCRTASWQKDQKIYFWRKASLRINRALLFCYDSCSSSNCWWCRELTSSKQIRHRTALLYLYIFFFLSELKNVNFDNSLEQLSHCFFNARK